MSHRRESIEEDDMTIRVGNSLVQERERERQTDGGGRATA